ncbi:MAG: hypothetical protein HC914_13145 [Chloroflexaceae bacterium]|nr:hypothetical protein [Chloroflexaceae bacterium]
MSTYNIWLSHPSGEPVAILDQFVALRYRRVVNATGHYRADGPRNELPLRLRLPYSNRLLPLLERDSRLSIWRNGQLETETCWLVQRIQTMLTPAGQWLLEVGAVPALAILASRIIAYPTGSAQATRSGPADDVMKALVRDNVGYAASDSSRNLDDWLGVAPDLSAAPSVAIACARQNLLDTLEALATAAAAAGTRLFFDVVQSAAGRLEFRTYTATRRTDRSLPTGTQPVLFAAEAGTLRTIERSIDYEDEVTVVYAAGQGAEGQRPISEQHDAARMVGSPFARRERFFDARHTSASSQLAAAAQAALAAGQPRHTLRAEILSQPGQAYGQHWYWGDRVAVTVQGTTLAASIDELVVEVTNDNNQPRETIQAWLSAANLPATSATPFQAAAPETEQTYQQVQRGTIASEEVLVIPTDGHLLVYGRYTLVGRLELEAGARLVVLT